MTYGDREIYTQWAHRSLTLWKEFQEQSGVDLFVPCGALFTSPRDSAYLTAARDVLSRNGIRHETLTSAALARRIPQLKAGANDIGLLEPDSGVLLARRAVQTVAQAAVRNGVDFEQRALTPELRKHVRAGGYIFACGPWLPRLFPAIIGRRIRPTRQAILFFGTDPQYGAGRMPAWVAFEEGVYALPDVENRGFKLAIDTHGPLFDPETGSRVVTPGEISTGRAALRRFFPAIAKAPLTETRVCQYENTSSGDFLIDRHPKWKDTWIVGGGSGHGFKHGPRMGEYVASLALAGGETDPLFALAAKSTRHRRTVH
jgi:glycine/D-amino acid oxidase-like deaminating enzyme